MTAIIVALDVPTADSAFSIVERLGDRIDFYKIGAPMFTQTGPAIVRELKARGKRVFLDLKYHDIPNTVARAVESAAALDVDFLTVHASGGSAMMRAAAEAGGIAGPRLLGVTILTSFTADDVEQVWDKKILSVRDEVVRLASHAAESGLHGIVALPLEAETLKRRHGPDFLVVTPGIRPSGGRTGDQARTATPADAARAGADYLVIGRPIIEAADPQGVVDAVLAEIAGAKEQPGLMMRIVIVACAFLACALPVHAQDVDRFMDRVAAAWEREDADEIASLGEPGGIAIQVDDTRVDALPRRQAAAVLRRVFSDRETLRVTAGTARTLPGNSARAYAEIVWVKRARGTTQAERINVFVAVEREGATWRITEIRLLP